MINVHVTGIYTSETSTMLRGLRFERISGPDADKVPNPGVYDDVLGWLAANGYTSSGYQVAQKFGAERSIVYRWRRDDPGKMLPAIKKRWGRAMEIVRRGYVDIHDEVIDGNDVIASGKVKSQLGTGNYNVSVTLLDGSLGDASCDCKDYLNPNLKGLNIPRWNDVRVCKHILAMAKEMS